jgi:hypothetical protein
MKPTLSPATRSSSLTLFFYGGRFSDHRVLTPPPPGAAKSGRNDLNKYVKYPLLPTGMGER